MRAAFLLLTAAAFATAQEDPSASDPVAARIGEFEQARGRVLEPGAAGAVTPAMDALLATGDARAVAPLAAFLVETLKLDLTLEEQSKDMQKRVAEAYQRMQSIERELQMLQVKERAGDPSAGPEIAKRVEERRRQQGIFDSGTSEVGRIGRQMEFVMETRERLTDGLAKLLAGLEGEAAGAAIADLRTNLHGGDRAKSLYFVRILRASGNPAAEEPLLAILASDSDEAVVRATMNALVPVLTPRGARSLLGLWEREPDTMAARVRHVLALVARRSLGSLDEARAWVDGFGK